MAVAFAAGPDQFPETTLEDPAEDPEGVRGGARTIQPRWARLVG